VIGATVDHGLQEGSAPHADRVVAQMAQLGADETVAVRVTVDPGGQGIEAAAREARYAVLAEVASRLASRVVLLGHTLDDQAETVLLGLVRGSGGRSIAGMRHAFDEFRRPLLEVTRAQTEAACTAEGIEPWEDPHNLTRDSPVRGCGTACSPCWRGARSRRPRPALARTADSLQADLAALDQAADECLATVSTGDGLMVTELARRPAAVRTRVLRLAALAAGSPASELFRVHVLAMDDLLSGAGNRSVDLPGHLRSRRHGDRLVFERA
jgi:tRNA(Ile)-lysidine synthase